MKKPTFHQLLLSVAVAFAGVGNLLGQDLGLEKQRHRTILSLIKNDVKKNYYDPTLKGIDIDQKFKAATDKMTAAGSVGELSGIVAQFLMDFDDSHMYFLPPPKVNKADHGIEFRMVGDRCLIVQVDKGSNAEQQGVRVGDEIWAINDFAPSRENLWKLSYLLFTLQPQAVLKLDLIDPMGGKKQILAQAKIRKGTPVRDLTGNNLDNYLRESDNAYRKATRQYANSIADRVFLWNIPAFSVDPDSVDGIMSKARKYPAIIFDLRGNGGGRVDMVVRLIGNLFEQDTKIADEKRRKETKEIIAKGRGKDAFKGQVVVLVDSGSASASEILARVIQIEKRGTVIGDRTAGAVMESRYYSHSLGMDVITYFAASVTIADLIMKDGKSLEKVGVTPDLLLIPTAKDLASSRDVVMAKALENVGVKVTPEQAGIWSSVDESKN